MGGIGLRLVVLVRVLKPGLPARKVGTPFGLTHGSIQRYESPASGQWLTFLEISLEICLGSPSTVVWVQDQDHFWDS